MQQLRWHISGASWDANDPNMPSVKAEPRNSSLKAYEFSYMYLLSIPVNGATEVKLPENRNIVIDQHLPEVIYEILDHGCKDSQNNIYLCYSW